MVCELPTPLWLDQSRAGLQSATEDIANSTYALVWGQAEAVAVATNPGATVYYNIYAGTDQFTLFDTPFAYSVGLTAEIPKSFLADAGDGYLFGLKAAQLGVTVDFSESNLPATMSEDSWLYPEPTTIRFDYDNFDDGYDGYLRVASVEGYPEEDGYILIGDEIIAYSTVVDGYDGYGAFWISNKDPFGGCNDGYNWLAGESVSLFRGFEDGNGILFQAAEMCSPVRPYWAEESRPGIDSAGDLGIGQVVELHWGPAIAPDGQQLLYNVFWATSLAGLWEFPKGITESETVLVPGLSPGDGYYFGVRATYYPNEVTVSDFEPLTGSLGAYPQSTVTTAVYSATGTLSLQANSTSGWPTSGYLIADSEILQYSSTTSTSFAISKRDVFDFGQQAEHPIGTTLRFWTGIEDSNYQYYRAETSWDRGEVSPLMPISGTPAYMQGADGYRTNATDNVTEDHSNFEAENENFPSYPYCGYRATNFVDLYSRRICNTYAGGRQDGFGGVDAGQVNLQRQEQLLGITGEPFTLLRRKWTGRQCAKSSHRHEHPHARCGICFGTNYTGGYDIYESNRELRPGLANPNGLIMVRVSPYKNDLERSQERGLTQVDELSSWTISIPQLRDSDVLVRYIYDPLTLEIIEEEFRYEVLNVTRNRIVLGNDGQQQFALRKLDKSEIIYSFAVPIV